MVGCSILGCKSRSEQKLDGLKFHSISDSLIHSFEEQTVVLILARGGSKGIRLKNLQVVGGITLLGRAILTARHAGLTDITVSTDHPLIALEGLKYNASIFKRSSITSSDYAPSIWGILEFLKTRPEISTIVLLQVTSPFIEAKQIRHSLVKLNHPIPFDCLFSVTKSYKLRWNCKKYYPINFNVNKRPRRQDWQGEFIETGAFYIARSHLLEKGYLQNNNCTVWEVSQADSLEIDTEYDIILANFILKHKLL